MKFPFLLFILALLHVGSLEAQTSPNLMGKVMDAFTKEPIPFATIKWALSKKGTIADSVGHFKIVRSSFLKDSLLVTYVGYEQTTFSPSQLKKDTVNIPLDYATSKNEAIVK